MNPMEQFHAWYSQAQQTEAEPERMSLATAGKDGMPSVRMVLLKQADEQGFVFYTNLNSVKAKQLAENPQAALCFYWLNPQRQVRVQGIVEQVNDDEADYYFQTRPRGSQIGAWASLQSQPLADYQRLQQRVAEYTERFAGHVIPRPAFWSGFRLKPSRIEFWEAGESRLHKRMVYQFSNHSWQMEWLFP
ncbi:MAG: pdxH [Gammaproteobacteria bacterium]|jgi:pyridoxamine 5'-phosphate oxidase|nr:pdxH [Gammaproteobacteria bacterium]